MPTNRDYEITVRRPPPLQWLAEDVVDVGVHMSGKGELHTIICRGHTRGK